MGIKLSKLVKGKETDFNSLCGRKIAIDAYLWMHQFLSSIRDYETGQPLRNSKGEITSVYSGLFYRGTRLLEAGIRPVFVFDGKKPEFKLEIIEERRKKREEAQIKWKEALKTGDKEAIRKAAQSALTLTPDIIENSKKLLRYMGIPVVEAPSEGEAQCSYLCKKEVVYAVGSQDLDCLAFGTPRLIRNLNISGRKKAPGKAYYMEIKPEIISLKDMLDQLDINQDQFIIMGMLIGTDFNPGIQKIGSKRALDLVKKEVTLEKVLKKIDWNSQFSENIVSAEKIFNFFKNPPTIDCKLEFGEIQKEKIIKLLHEDFEFSIERIENAIKRVENAKPKNSLMKWMK